MLTDDLIVTLYGWLSIIISRLLYSLEPHTVAPIYGALLLCSRRC